MESCRDTGQLIDRECGRRDQAARRRLTERLQKLNARCCCTDKWKAADPLETDKNALLRRKSGAVHTEELIVAGATGLRDFAGSQRMFHGARIWLA